MSTAVIVTLTEDEVEVAEKGSLPLTLAFYDDDGDAVTPTSATWTLTDDDGTVMNDRLDVAISPLSTSAKLCPDGDDLEVPDRTKANRRLLIEWVYNSATFGNNRHQKMEIRFPIKLMPGVEATA